MCENNWGVRLKTNSSTSKLSMMIITCFGFVWCGVGRLESVIRGREKFERNTHAGGLTNLEKERKKNFLMVRKGNAVNRKTRMGAKQVSGGAFFSFVRCASVALLKVVGLVPKVPLRGVIAHFAPVVAGRLGVPTLK